MAFPKDVEGIERQLAEQRGVLLETARATDGAAVRRRGIALWTMGEDLLRLGQLEDGANRLGEAAATLWLFPADHSTAVIACSRQATALMKLGRDHDAYEVLEAVIGKIGLEWHYEELPDLMALVLADFLNLLDTKATASAHGREGLIEQEEEVADVVLRRYQGHTSTQRIAIGRALRLKAISAIMRADWMAALAFCDDLVRRCPIEDDDAARDCSVEMRLSALTTRGFVLEQLARTDEALASYEEALEQGKSATPWPSIETILKDAQQGKKRARSRWRRARR